MYEATTKQKKDGNFSQKYKHKCGWDRCPFCDKVVELATHQCFIQPVDPQQDEPKEKKVALGEVGTRAYRVDEKGDVWVELSKPYLVFADYEAVTDADGVQSPILVCAEAEDEDMPHTFYGPDCSAEFMEHLDSLTVDAYGDERKVICIFHNFKGYDGMFILQHLYETHREVEDQVCIGTKVLSLTTGDITFKDSLCFLPFPLSAFPSTFGITEQCKGFFPHLFNTIENQNYDGPMPPAEMYDPDGMSSKVKAGFETWYRKKTEDGYILT